MSTQYAFLSEGRIESVNPWKKHDRGEEDEQRSKDEHKRWPKTWLRAWTATHDKKPGQLIRVASSIETVPKVPLRTLKIYIKSSKNPMTIIFSLKWSETIGHFWRPGYWGMKEVKCVQGENSERQSSCGQNQQNYLKHGDTNMIPNGLCKLIEYFLIYFVLGFLRCWCIRGSGFSGSHS